MSLSPDEQQALESIEDSLSDTDPKLASLLATFTRLTAGEEMPVPEEIPADGRWAIGFRSRPRPDTAGRAARRLRQHLGWPRAGLLLLLSVTVAMIAATLALSHGGGSGTCTAAWASACAAQKPGALHPAAQKQTPSQLAGPGGRPRSGVNETTGVVPLQGRQVNQGCTHALPCPGGAYRMHP